MYKDKILKSLDTELEHLSRESLEDIERTERKYLLNIIGKFLLRKDINQKQLYEMINAVVYKWRRFNIGAKIVFYYSSKKNLAQRRIIDALIICPKNYFELYKCVKPKISYRNYSHAASENNKKIRYKIQVLNKQLKSHGFIIRRKQDSFTLQNSRNSLI